MLGGRASGARTHARVFYGAETCSCHKAVPVEVAPDVVSYMWIGEMSAARVVLNHLHQGCPNPVGLIRAAFSVLPDRKSFCQGTWHSR